MTFSLNRTSVGKHLLFAFVGWYVFFTIVAVILPPLDSHEQVSSLATGVMLTIAVMLGIYIAILVPAYFFLAWKELPSVPNKISYAVWMGFETLVFIAILIGFGYALRDTQKSIAAAARHYSGKTAAAPQPGRR